MSQPASSLYDRMIQRAAVQLAGVTSSVKLNAMQLLVRLVPFSLGPNCPAHRASGMVRRPSPLLSVPLEIKDLLNRDMSSLT